MKARELELKAHSLHERFHTNALMPTTKSPKPPSAIPDTPIMTIVLLAIPTFLQTYPALLTLLKPKPELVPRGFLMGGADGRFTLRRWLFEQPRIWDMVHDRLDPGCGVEAYPCRLELLVIGFTIV